MTWAVALMWAIGIALVAFVAGYGAGKIDGRKIGYRDGVNWSTAKWEKAMFCVDSDNNEPWREDGEGRYRRSVR